MNFRLFSLVAGFALLMPGCSKDKEGPQGEPGPSGNANVTVYNYATQTFTGSVNYTLKNTSQARIDSSLVLAYYNPALEAPTSWYPVPGLGSGGLYDTRSFIFPAVNNVDFNYTVRLVNANGTGGYTGQVTFTKFRIFIVPANNILVGGRMANQPAAPVDYSDYHKVCAYYNIPE